MVVSDNLLVLIPARGGSTGLPGKNIRVLGDLPLIGWCKEALVAAGMDGARTILSSDDKVICEVGRSLNIEVPFLRPREIATGTTSLVDVGLHALDWLEENSSDAVPEFILFLLATQPFRDPLVLREAFNRFDDPTVDGVMSVYEIERSLGVMFYTDSDDRVTSIGPPVKAEQRQEIRPIVTPSGCFFYLRTSALREQETLYPKNVRAIATAPLTNIDIDTPTDWSMAKAIYDAGLAWRKPKDSSC